MQETWRLSAALLVSAFMALGLGPLLIPRLKQLKAGAQIRAEMQASHQAKAGTPTMGGVLFVIPAAVATLLFAPRQGDALIRVAVALLLMLGHGLIGFADDWMKVVMRRSLGLRAREKLIAQLALALLLAYGAVELLGLGTAVDVPFTGGWSLELGRPLYYLLVLIMVWGTVNAVNFTDGLDGLLGGCSIIVFGFYAIFVAAVKGYMDMAVLGVALMGGCFGFLRYNNYPARIFMGDVGSFALGGALVALAVLTKTELLLVIVGGVFVVEALSVIIQVVSFRTTGKRIFKMAPLHHHFELLGWSEPRILRFFWGAGLLLAVVGWFGARDLLW
jgi:phospho-N-acetylmuramoyl-pentapeptide-transferase